MINRTIAPPIRNAAHFTINLPACRTYKLDNGIPVYIVPSSEQETMLIDISFAAGNWYESLPLQAIATNHLIKNGTLQHTTLEINESIEFYGAYLNRQCNHDHANYTLHCLTKYIGELLPTLQEVLREPAFPEQELELYKQNMKQRLAVNLRKSEFVANRHIDEYLFGAHHPYGRYSSMQAYDNLQVENLRDFYTTYYSSRRAILFVAGNVPEDIVSQLNHYFGADEWNVGPEQIRKDIPIEPAAERKYRIVNDPDGVQGAIRVARLFPNRYHPDFPKMQVLNAILGGYFGSRLMSNIREDKGYTYGIHSSLYNFRQHSALSIQTEAGREVCEATVREIYREMEILRQEPVPEEELSLVRNYIIGNILGDLDGAFQVIQRWKNLVLGGLDENYFYHQVNTFKTITTNELQELAQRYFIPEDFYELVVT